MFVKAGDVVFRRQSEHCQVHLVTCECDECGECDECAPCGEAGVWWGCDPMQLRLDRRIGRHLIGGVVNSRKAKQSQAEDFTEQLLPN